RESVHAGRVADGDAAHARGVEVDVVRARAPDRHELEGGAGGEDALGEAGMRADVDRDLGPADATDELLLVVGAALREHGDLARLLQAAVRHAALEDRGKIVRDDDHAAALAKMAWAADTPAPASHV